MSVKRCREEVDAEEFAYWRAYYNITPVEDGRVEHLLGLLCYMFYSANTDSKKHKMSVDDYVPELAEKPEHKASRELAKMKQTLRSLALMGHGRYKEAK